MRMVDKFGVGRVFVAGDAAHCHSPTGGQGLNSSVQDAVNLGWKLALVANACAPSTLLDSYSAERLPVIAEMLQLTTALHEKTTAQLDTSKDDDGAWKRGGALSMLGVNACGSAIVLAGQGVPVQGGGAYDAGVEVQAGSRAPDAPGLVGAAACLFGLFGVAAHTVLIFGGNTAAHGSVARALGSWPRSAVRVVLVARTAAEAAGSAVFGEGLGDVVEDRGRHAYASYADALSEEEMRIVVVRPDGMVGAVVEGAAGIESYRKLIFG